MSGIPALVMVCPPIREAVSPPTSVVKPEIVCPPRTKIGAPDVRLTIAPTSQRSISRANQPEVLVPSHLPGPKGSANVP